MFTNNFQLGLREHTMKVYSMCSRQELSEVRDTFLTMRITHFVLEEDQGRMPDVRNIGHRAALKQGFILGAFF